jgi:hypothetical protein
MRRADFKAIADTIRMHRLQAQAYLVDPTVISLALLEDLCVVFRKSNPTFDKGKFLRACGFYQE